MPTTLRWQLQTPVNAIIFDCDGTLTSIEGIDELAEQNHVGSTVKALTAEAMSKTGLNPEVYRRRLELVKPNRDQVFQLGAEYFAKRVPDAADVIKYLQRLNKSIYLISAGLSPAVVTFGQLLNIPVKHILSVDIKFDHDGNYVNFDDTSPLAYHDGKRRVVSELKQQYGRVVHIGDGINDLVAHDIATRFIGYGGIYYRDNIAAACNYYIKTASLAAILPLVLTAQETQSLLEPERQLYDKGLHAIDEGEVLIKPV